MESTAKIISLLSQLTNCSHLAPPRLFPGLRQPAAAFLSQPAGPVVPGPTLGRAKVGFTMVMELSRFCFRQDSNNDPDQGRTIRTGRHVSVPKARSVTAEGNALGKCETNSPSPTGAKWSCFLHYALSGNAVKDLLCQIRECCSATLFPGTLNPNGILQQSLGSP